MEGPSITVKERYGQNSKMLPRQQVMFLAYVSCKLLATSLAHSGSKASIIALPTGPHSKRGIVITTDSLLFWIQMSEQNSLLCGGELHDNLPHSQPTFLHIIIPSWQLTVSMHQISSLICNQHKKLMVKTTILFLLCTRSNLRMVRPSGRW